MLRIPNVECARCCRRSRNDPCLWVNIRDLCFQETVALVEGSRSSDLSSLLCWTLGKMDVGAEWALPLPLLVAVIATFELPLLPLWAAQSGEWAHSSNTCVPGLPCWKLWGAAPAFQPLQGTPGPSLPRIPESPALSHKAPPLIRAGGKETSRVCSEQELIKIQKVISLLCPLITGNPGRPDQT